MPPQYFEDNVFKPRNLGVRTAYTFLNFDNPEEFDIELFLRLGNGSIFKFDPAKGTLTVPDSLAGKIIGKGGSHIKLLSQKFGRTLKVIPKPSYHFRFHSSRPKVVHGKGVVGYYYPTLKMIPDVLFWNQRTEDISGFVMGISSEQEFEDLVLKYMEEE